MSLFDDWCGTTNSVDGQKRLLKLEEKSGGRAKVEQQLTERVRSHYDALDRIADDVKALGYEAAGAILKERLPRKPSARSGELAENLNRIHRSEIELQRFLAAPPL